MLGHLLDTRPRLRAHHRLCLVTCTACRNCPSLGGSKCDGSVGYCAGQHSSWKLPTAPLSNGLRNAPSAASLKCLYLGQFCISFVVKFCHACTHTSGSDRAIARLGRSRGFRLGAQRTARARAQHLRLVLSIVRGNDFRAKLVWPQLSYF